VEKLGAETAAKKKAAQAAEAKAVLQKKVSEP
jgi:hypothetical protein